MSSTFLALQIGTSGLQASMMGVDTAGHNVANAATPGYSREVVDLSTDPSLQIFTDHVTYLGQGVSPGGQNRINDKFLDAQYHANNAQQSYWQTQSTEINNVAAIFNEPTGTTLRQNIDGFYNAWNQLAQTPADTGARAAVYQAGQSLADAFHTTNSSLAQNITRYGTNLTASVTDANSIVTSIAALNTQIEKAQAEGTAPNDLLDQRDALLNKLSGYAAFNVIYTPDATNPSVTHVAVSLNLNSTSTFGSAVPLVTDGTVNSVFSTGASAAGAPNSVSVADLQTKNGSLSSLNDMITYTNNVVGQVNQLALNLSQAVDTAHTGGYGLNGQTGNALFNSASLTAANAAANIAVNAAITPSSLNLLAAATQNTTGNVNQTDGSQAQAISSQLPTYDAQYSGIVDQLGTSGQVANQQNQTFTALTTQATQARDALSGVNINDEMSNMVQYQQSYGAASKFISVFNDMLNTLMQSV